jgi:CRISPR-associated protein Cas1
MPSKRKTPGGHVEVAAGYGVKIHVERGHLIVHDGVGRTRATRRYNRATAKFDRLVVIGHTGFVTFEALRWIRDIGATFVQIDSDSEVITMSVSDHESSARDLRRAQVVAAESERGRTILSTLLKAKVIEQARLAGDLVQFQPTEGSRHRRPPDPVGSILAQIPVIEDAPDLTKLRVAESVAGRLFWLGFANVPIRFDRSWRGRVPDHWHQAGPRTTARERKRPKRAQSPAHAMLNYLYAILETEATIALRRMGLDPTLGLMHSDKRYRPSLASDLMEPVRPVADRIVFDYLLTKELKRGDVVEARDGVCRLGLPMIRELAVRTFELREGIWPYAEHLAEDLLEAADHPTPLTRRRHRQSLLGR